MDQFARGPFNVHYEERLDPAALRAQRVAKALAQMASAGLDALLVWKDENVRYLTDLRPQLIAGKSTALNGALLIPGHAPILLCSGGEVDRVRQTMPWIQEVHAVPIIEERDLVAGMVRDILGPLLREHGILSAGKSAANGPRLGLDEANMVFYSELTGQFPNLRVVDGDSPMLAARRHKLPGEIVLLEEATAIADAVTAAAVAASQEGARECDVAAAGMATLFRLGGEYAHVMTPFVASGEHMAPPHRITSDKLIRHGDLVFIDIGACWNGYFGDMARTVVCGTPSRRQQEVFTAVYAALHEGIAAMRPGNTNVDAMRAFHAGAARYGLADRFFSLFIGHGVGIGANEPPYVGETLPGAPTYHFEPGMVFAIEPLIWVPGVRGGGGVRLEEMVLITEGDPHVMSRAPFDQRLLLA